MAWKNRGETSKVLLKCGGFVRPQLNVSTLILIGVQLECEGDEQSFLQSRLCPISDNIYTDPQHRYSAYMYAGNVLLVFSNRVILLFLYTCWQSRTMSKRGQSTSFIAGMNSCVCFYTQYVSSMLIRKPNNSIKVKDMCNCIITQPEHTVWAVCRFLLTQPHN